MQTQKHLTKDEELSLGRKIQAYYFSLENPEDFKRKELELIRSEGLDAIDALVASNVGLVYNIAKKFKLKFPAGPDLEDIVSMGTIGLIVAVKKYDPSRNNKFSTVAYHWIHQSIEREVNKTSRMIRLPENRIIDFTRINSVMRDYEESGLPEGKTAYEVLNEELGLSKRVVQNILDVAYGHTSLNQHVSDGSDSPRELGDIIAEGSSSLNNTMSVENMVIANESMSILYNELSDLSPLKRIIVAAQFSLNDGEHSSTPQQIREDHQLSPSKYRRLLNEGIGELRVILEKKELRLSDFIDD